MLSMTDPLECVRTLSSELTLKIGLEEIFLLLHSFQRKKEMPGIFFQSNAATFER